MLSLSIRISRMNPSYFHSFFNAVIWYRDVLITALSAAQQVIRSNPNDIKAWHLLSCVSYSDAMLQQQQQQQTQLSQQVRKWKSLENVLSTTIHLYNKVLLSL